MEVLNEAIYNKKSYKNLIKYLHSKNFYKNYNKFTNENREEILSNFRFVREERISNNDWECGQRGLCFCSKQLRIVNYIYCSLTNELIQSGGKCKELFKNTKYNNDRFNRNFIRQFSNGLGFSPILDWNEYVKEVLEDFIQGLYNNKKHDELDRLLDIYEDDRNIKNLIWGIIWYNRKRESERRERELARQAEIEKEERERKESLRIQRERDEKWEREQAERKAKQEAKEKEERRELERFMSFRERRKQVEETTGISEDERIRRYIAIHREQYPQPNYDSDEDDIRAISKYRNTNIKF